MTSLVDKLHNQKNFNEVLSFKLSLQVCAMNIIQCLHAQQLHTVFKILYIQQFLFCLLLYAFFVCVHSRYDTIKSFNTNIYVCHYKSCSKVRFFYLYIFFISSLKFCYTLLCTCVYKISKFVHNTYTKILSHHKSKNVCVYGICKFVHGSYY